MSREPGGATSRAAKTINADNLSPNFVADLTALYGGTRLAAQELDGLIGEDLEGALWRTADLGRARGPAPGTVRAGGRRAEPAGHRHVRRVRDSGLRPVGGTGFCAGRPVCAGAVAPGLGRASGGAAREIALAFGVSRQLLGIPGDATYANYRGAHGAVWRQTVLPVAKRAARAMTGWLEARLEGCVIACELENIPALTAEREALWARLAAASFLADEERREMAGVDRG